MSECFHCGEPVPSGTDWLTTIEGTPRPMCCIGCQTISKAIVDAGATSYYTQRTTKALDIETLEALSPWASLLEDPQWAAQHVRSDASESNATLAIEGLRCGACAWLIEKILAQTPGVMSATANASTARLNIRWQPETTSLSKVAQRISAIGYALLPIGSAPVEAARKASDRKSLRRLFVAGLASAQVMMYAYPEYMEGGGLDDDIRYLMRTASLLITIPVMAYSATPFFQAAWRMLRQKRLGMDVPVSLGLWIAFVASLWAWWTNTGEIYFDSVSMFVFLLLSARWVEARIRARTSHQRERLATAPPLLAHRLSPDPGDIAAWNLQPGDRIRVNSGDRVPADSLLQSAATELDNSWLTGESLPVSIQHGDRIAEGAINLGPAIEVLVETRVSEGTLSRLSQLAESAAADRPQWVTWADQVGAMFTAGILLISAAVIGVSISLDIPSSQWIASVIAVLVVTCPCALSMAGPAAYAAALARLLENGIAISSSRTIERLSTINSVVFDKTGTLTDPAQSDVEMCFGELLLWPAIERLARESRHPLARAIAHCAREKIREFNLDQNTPFMQDALQHAGLGIEATWQGQRVKLGSKHFVDPQHSYAHLTDQHPQATVFFSVDGVVRAGFSIQDRPRPEALGLLAALKRLGLRLWVFSGDQRERVEQLAVALGLNPNQTLAQCTPDQKQQRVQALQQENSIVLMVGDGHNDAPVLAQADVSIAVQGAAPLAKQKADVYLLRPGLNGVAEALRISQRAKKILNQNLAWALGYNVVAVPFAALGYISPLLASIGMAASSMLVVLNSARLLKN
jgi:P-type Cu2+ transporter